MGWIVRTSLLYSRCKVIMCVVLMNLGDLIFFLHFPIMSCSELVAINGWNVQAFSQCHHENISNNLTLHLASPCYSYVHRNCGKGGLISSQQCPTKYVLKIRFGVCFKMRVMEDESRIVCIVKSSQIATQKNKEWETTLGVQLGIKIEIA